LHINIFYYIFAKNKIEENMKKKGIIWTVDKQGHVSLSEENMERIGIISGKDAVVFMKNMDNQNKISESEKKRIKKNYNKLKKIECYDYVDETIQEKIRNQLTPYWDIVSILDIYDTLTEDKKIKCWNIIKKDIEIIKKHQDQLLTLIDSTYEEKND